MLDPVTDRRPCFDPYRHFRLGPAYIGYLERTCNLTSPLSRFLAAPGVPANFFLSNYFSQQLRSTIFSFADAALVVSAEKSVALASAFDSIAAGLPLIALPDFAAPTGLIAREDYDIALNWAAFKPTLELLMAKPHASQEKARRALSFALRLARGDARPQNRRRGVAPHQRPAVTQQSRDLGAVLEALRRLPPDWHPFGTLHIDVLEAVVRQTSGMVIPSSIETGFGASTFSFPTLAKSIPPFHCPIP